MSLAELAAGVGPLAVIDLETTGLSNQADSEILEIGAVLVDPGASRVATLGTLVRPSVPIPRLIQRLTGIADSDVADAPSFSDVVGPLRELLVGRAFVAHNAEFERYFLARFVSPDFAESVYLDTQDLLALTHPDAPDLRLESFTRLLLQSEEQHRALDDALDTARILSRVGQGGRAGEPRYAAARGALESYAPGSPWLALLGKQSAAAFFPAPSDYVSVGVSEEAPVPFDEDAIAEVLADEARGQRHFPGYRVRDAQVRLARHFVNNLQGEGVLLLEGGTGVGKSLAYLAAAIPFAMEEDEERGPVVISTRTKLLQDQLLAKDIAAAARFLGYPGLRAISIKGRANYVCERSLMSVLAEGSEPRIFAEDRLAYASLATCAQTRPHGEIGAVPSALLRRFPPLRDMLRRSVAARPEQCSREQCAKHASCPFGRKRAALARAHLIVANHDLLLRWPPDYPAFQHCIADEVHELAGVADDVYALEVRPEEILDRIDDVFGRPGDKKRDALLSRGKRRQLAKDASAWRRGLHQDLVALGHALDPFAGDFGEVDIPREPQNEFAEPARAAEAAADRLDLVASEIESVLASPDASGEEAMPLQRAAGDLRVAGAGLRKALSGEGDDSVAGFEGVESPWDRWRMTLRAVSLEEPFEEHFLERLHSFAGVSASVFIGGSAFAALGELGIEQRARDRLTKVSQPSPFPYTEHMRVVALASPDDLVGQTSAVLTQVAKQLGGRTLGLFTSLQRMQQVAGLLSESLRGSGIEILLPRRASDDPHALVQRFRRGSSVLLGARKFWQGLDIRGNDLQAVVIEKLPFEVPTELRRRRESLLRSEGIDVFGQYTLGKMLLNLKQMVGRLIRSEEDRGVVVIVEGRPEKPYFRRLAEALPPDSEVNLVETQDLTGILEELGILSEDVE